MISQSTPLTLRPPSRVLLLGGRGYLGSYFLSLYPGALVPQVDVTDAAALGRALDDACPDVVINCAGKTGRPNVDWCEQHKQATLAANVTGALNVLDACLRRDIYLVHLSSGCIYEGDNGGRGFSEDDTPNYHGSFYSRTKLWADQACRDFPVLTLRLRMPFDGTLSERNLIVKLRKYRRVLTEPNSLTHLPDFLRVARELIARRAIGVYNVVNEGVISPYAIMLRYRELVDRRHAFEPLAPEELDQVARTGRSNCVLSTDKLRALGLRMPGVREAVDAALGQLAARLSAPDSRTA
jgi:dTDP-4-dehydrorhamnose reductase